MVVPQQVLCVVSSFLVVFATANRDRSLEDLKFLNPFSLAPTP
jgi:hypothetical protein